MVINKKAPTPQTPKTGRLCKEELLKFVNQVRVEGSIDMFGVAEKLGYNWFRQVKPRIKTDLWFREALQEALEAIKFELYQGLLRVGRDGRIRGSNPEITYINSVIRHIDSGSILGVSEEDMGQQPDKDETEAHLKRLGILDSESKDDDDLI